jgi:hypothetical protein
MEWGEALPAIKRAASHGSAAAIARLDSEPKLSPWLAGVWSAFRRLSTCRQLGMGMGPIPWTAVKDYALMEGMDRDEFTEFDYLIEAMDSEYLAVQSERRDK